MKFLELKSLIHGRVQGVSFRAKVASIARQLKLTGYAKNLSDGTVEVLAVGDHEALEKLLGEIANLRHPVKVENILSSYYPPTYAEEGFKIL